MNLSDLIIVLARPAEAGNVGAVCRAMKNMGLSRLRLAAPEFFIESSSTGNPLGENASGENTSFVEALSRQGALSEAGYGYGGNEAIIRARAVHAFDVWERAETFDSLAAAVSDCALVIGTTRRRGRHRKQVSMTAAEAASFLREHSGPAAIVFGNERTGLDDGEITLCNLASHIPVDEAFSSINLSHAVQIFAYELFQAMACPEAVKGQWVPMDQKAMDGLVREVTDNLKTLGFYKQAGREEQERFFRDIFSRAAMTEREGRYFSGLIARATRLSAKQ